MERGVDVIPARAPPADERSDELEPGASSRSVEMEWPRFRRGVGGAWGGVSVAPVDGLSGDDTLTVAVESEEDAVRADGIDDGGNVGKWGERVGSVPLYTTTRVRKRVGRVTVSGIEHCSRGKILPKIGWCQGRRARSRLRLYGVVSLFFKV